MTQIVVTLESGADSALLLQMIENMKGVMNAKVKQTRREVSDKTEEWIKKVNGLADSFRHTPIDLKDERIKYLMSK